MSDMEYIIEHVRGDCGALHKTVEEWQRCEICESILLSRLTLEQRVRRLERKQTAI